MPFISRYGPSQEDSVCLSLEKIPAIPIESGFLRQRFSPRMILLIAVTQEDIVEGLRALGVKRGMGVMVHSSLSSFGRVEGGPRVVVQALMEVVTKAGTLMFPSFNHGRPFMRGGAGYFDPKHTKTINGAIAETFWRMPGVYRSVNPTHAFAAWGRHARRYTKNHHRTLTVGPQSPLGMLWKDGGYGLLIGVNYKVNTFHHVVEMTTGAPCLGSRTEELPMRLVEGRKVMGRTWGYRAGICPLSDRAYYARVMARKELHKQARIGKSKLTLFQLEKCYRVLSRLFAEGTPSLPPCSKCPIRPRKNKHTVPSDWDQDAGRLKPDSPSRMF